jgi:hypothetical protein
MIKKYKLLDYKITTKMVNDQVPSSELVHKAINLELSADELSDIAGFRHHFAIADYYDYSLIKNGFNAYLSKTIDLEYFHDWLAVYGRALKDYVVEIDELMGFEYDPYAILINDVASHLIALAWETWLPGRWCDYSNLNEEEIAGREEILRKSQTKRLCKELERLAKLDYQIKEVRFELTKEDKKSITTPDILALSSEQYQNLTNNRLDEELKQLEIFYTKSDDEIEYHQDILAINHFKKTALLTHKVDIRNVPVWPKEKIFLDGRAFTSLKEQLEKAGYDISDCAFEGEDIPTKDEIKKAIMQKLTLEDIEEISNFSYFEIDDYYNSNALLGGLRDFISGKLNSSYFNAWISIYYQALTSYIDQFCLNDGRYDKDDKYILALQEMTDVLFIIVDSYLGDYDLQSQIEVEGLFPLIKKIDRQIKKEQTNKAKNTN